MKKDSKSLYFNMILNGIRGLLSVLFPLITFPYISRVLGVENIGKYNFANSIITYFVMLSELGIATYAVREGARIRNDRTMVDKFSSEVFSINIISMLVSYLLFSITLITMNGLAAYKPLLLILSLQILFRTITVDWIYNIYEAYVFTTVRSIIFQAVSLICMFAFVKNAEDVNAYALISVFALGGAGVINFINARKYCKISLVFHRDLLKHMKSILVLFALAVTVTIYVSADITILGFFCGDRTVGIYSVSVKIYTIVKILLTYILMVSVPHLAVALGEHNEDEFNEIATKMHNLLLTFALPAMIGIILLRKELIEIVAGNDYLSAESSLVFLSLALIFGMLAYFWSQCILINFKMDTLVFKITTVSACTNIILNIVLIRFWKENAAAITTILAEAISYACCCHFGKKFVMIKGIVYVFWKTFIGCVVMFFLTLVLQSVMLSRVYNTIIIIIVDIVLFMITQVILKNPVILELLNKVKK